MGKNKVVVRFKNGSILKGNTSDFLPNKSQFHLETENGDIQTVDVDKLKAIFFVRDLTKITSNPMKTTSAAPAEK